MVDERAVQDLGARDVDVAPIGRSYVGLSEFDAFDDPFELAGTNEITDLERPAKGEKETGKDILADLTKRKTKNDGGNPPAGEDRCGNPLQAQQPEGDGEAHQQEEPFDECFKEVSVGWRQDHPAHRQTNRASREATGNICHRDRQHGGGETW